MATTPLGKAETTETVRLEDKVAILLTSEKPVYQPAQTIHLRALALNRADERAATEQSLTFEIEDPRGNKVFRRATKTDEFGVASAEFALADEVNLGAYHVHVRMGDEESAENTAELTVNVDRYVLPKFRVAVEFEKKDGRAKRDYRPGDHVTGEVQANYFFGKPVANAEVVIKAAAMDVGLYDAVAAEGRTDEKGAYHFDLTLPKFFAGRKTSHGAAPVVMEATVKDSADHSETRGESITVSQEPMLITAVPEGGQLAAGMENEVYILASYPDGTPAKADLHVRAGDRSIGHVSTDDAGIAAVHFVPSNGGDELQIEADDHHGSRVSTVVHPELRSGNDQVLVRTSQAVYKPGDRLDMSVISTKQRGAAYIDVVRDQQTILTRDVELANGHAEISVPVTAEMSGTMVVNAYLFGGDAETIADRRLVFVQPADELHVEATSDADSYLPGGEARVHFRVTNARGEGVHAALGLEVVDQAVFALAEKKPGFAKVFFYLEQELMKPRYEIHSLDECDVVSHEESKSDEQRDRVARVLFSATEDVKPHSVDTETGRLLPQSAAADYAERYREAFTEYVKRIAARLTTESQSHRSRFLPDLFKGIHDDQGRTPHDAWGTELRFEAAGFSQQVRYYSVRSAGPDRQFDTADDQTVVLEAHTGTVVSPGNRGFIQVHMEHNRGPNNGLAEIKGVVMDASGAVVARASVTLRRVDNAQVREALTDANGAFVVGGLASGRYACRISAMGFVTAARSILVGAGDRGALSVQLEVGAVTEAVTVEAAVIPLATRAMAVGGPMFDAPIPPAAMAASGASMHGVIGGLFAQKAANQAGETKNAADTHVRSYFPEALYVNPEIVTDGRGDATIEIPLADSITTWRMAMFASTKNGALGSGTSALKVFKDFFVDLDLPVTLTQGDRVTIPVALYNYVGQKGDVTLALEQCDWFALDDDVDEKTVAVEAGRVGAAQFTIEAKQIGKFKLTIAAKMQGEAERSDTVVREIEVVPNGRQQEIVFNGRLDSSVRHTIRFPASAIPEASKIFVRLYPGPLSQVIEGMDGILSMPGGCFEQTSSSTYPNVLALDYMKRTKKLTPEVHARAEGYIANGYQRLLTFEVPGGGFSWFGRAPANKILTSYGLMEFHDMANVHDIDPRLIERTRDWLVAQQQADGSWKPDTEFINEGATNRYNSDVLRITAYIGWALEATGDRGDAIGKAKSYVQAHLGKKIDAYTLAVLANFAVDGEKDTAFTERILEMLIDAATVKGEQEWWSADETSVYATGESAAVETTGLAVQALMKSGAHLETVRKALAWITSKKTGAGNWGTTQATIMALRALVMASEGGGADALGDVDVVLNGKTVETVILTSENNDLLHQFVLKDLDAKSDDNEVELRFEGKGGLAYQIAARYFVPWEAATAREPLSIQVSYDRTRLTQDETVTATATVRNNLDKTAKMVMVDLGIPPGFELLSEDLQAIVKKSADARNGRLEKFSLTATQAILYFDGLAPGTAVNLQFRMRAKFPIRATNFESRVYEYYDPGVSATARPGRFEVIAK